MDHPKTIWIRFGNKPEEISNAPTTLPFALDLIRAVKIEHFPDIPPSKMRLYTSQGGTRIDPRRPVQELLQYPELFLEVPPVADSAASPGGPGSSSKRKRHVVYSLKDAIEGAGLTEKAVVDGESDISLLNDKERVSLLDYIGSEVDRTDTFHSLSSTARTCRNRPFEELDILSSSSNAHFPVVETKGIYVRKGYKKLYSEITTKLAGNPGNKRVVVTGTSGIGKSAFLVYFTIRLLATSHDDSPPIVIFHDKGSSKCYVYGGVSTLRYGDIEDFRPFLSLPKTWYLVDSSPVPQLVTARTIISVSPKTLYSEGNYHDVDKKVPWRYYMAPWDLEELKRCQSGIKDFQALTDGFMEELYNLVGGVPRYVLEKPKDVLSIDPGDIASAKKCAYERVQLAIDFVKDPQHMMQCFRQGRESLEFSSRLLHRWPSDDHKDFHLAWASAHIREKVSESLKENAWKQILQSLVEDSDGSAAKGIMFETYVLHIFRKGSCVFEAKNLQNATTTTVTVPNHRAVEYFREIGSLSAAGNTLHIPRQCNYPCVDMLLEPNHLFQVTVSQTHNIKGQPFLTLLQSLIQHRWITSCNEAVLIFVVPSDIYDKFQAQKYLTMDGKVYQRVPGQLPQVKQLVLKIDLDAASKGKSPGISGSAY